MQVDTLDVVVLVAILVGSIAYFTKGSLWGKVQDPYEQNYGTLGARKSGQTRDVIEKMQQTGKNAVVFYGSQTGTAEDYATRLAKEGSQRFGLKTMLADLEDYDYEILDKFPHDHVAFFVLATYGEGEPTDNAAEFYNFISSEDVTFESGATAIDKPLSSMKYVAFGLGNNTYEHYNFMVKNVDAALQTLGAHRVGTAGEGDDGAGTMEEDFLAWKEPMWKDLSRSFGLEERESSYEPSIEIKEENDLTDKAGHVYVGEHSKNHLNDEPEGPFGPSNPFIASVAESRELFSSKDRNCLHLEIDVGNSNLSYQTGDHAAIWPNNPGKEVDRFLHLFGLYEKRGSVISVKPIDVTAKVPFPTPTTYDAVVRHYMEICGPASRQLIASIVPFAPDEVSKNELKRLGSNKDYFHDKITNKYLNIAQALQSVTSKPFTDAPFSFLIESIPKLQPRYYSISSSSEVQKDKLSITAIVESIRIPSSEHVLKGVTTNYLLALKNKQNGEIDATDLNYQLMGPRGKYKGIQLPVHVRHSNFKLPSDPTKPIIMVGPGTGVAPFRAFVQERVALAAHGEKIGTTVLFFGCRREKEDFLYSDEWKVL